MTRDADLTHGASLTMDSRVNGTAPTIEMNGPTLGPESCHSLVVEYEKGMSVSALARAYYITDAAVVAILVSAGAKSPHKDAAPDVVALARGLDDDEDELEADDGDPVEAFAAAADDARQQAIAAAAKLVDPRGGPAVISARAERDAEIVRLLPTMYPAEAARHFNVSLSTLQGIARKHGVKFKRYVRNAESMRAARDARARRIASSRTKWTPSSAGVM